MKIQVIRISILLGLVLLGKMCSAQTEKASHFNTWWSLRAKVDVSDKLYFNTQISLRRYDILKYWQKIILRGRLMYRINNDFSAGIGYTFSSNYEHAQPERYVAIPRNDIFTEVSFRNTFDNLKLYNRFRLEHRFAGIMILPEDESKEAYIDGTKFSNRLRYRITFKHPIILKNKKTKMYAAGFYELFLRMDSGFRILNISGNIFKIVGGYALTDNVTLEAGYRRHIKHEKDYSFKEINNILDLSLKYRFALIDAVDKIIPFMNNQ